MTGPAPAAAAAPPALRLGFGCGSLGSEIGYRDSCALIEAAYEAGFRHFDVAPPYGNGMAERILGDVLAPVRQHITLVSKAGIAHPQNAALLRALRQLALPVRRAWPSLWRRAAGTARRVAAPRGQFAVDTVRASLDESLRRLRTDYLDALLLHEVQPGDIDDELATWLLRQRAEGRVKALGIGTGVGASVALLAQHPLLLDWVQTDHYWGAFEPALRGVGKLVTHGSMRTGMALLRLPAVKAAMPSRLAQHLRDESQIAPILAHAALAALEPIGITLVSTTKRNRIAKILKPTMSKNSSCMFSALNLLMADPASEAYVNF